MEEDSDYIKDRLEKFLTAEKMTAMKFAEIMEIQPSNISHFMKGRNKPNFDFIARFFLRFPDVNPDWFMNGIGEMYRNEKQGKNDEVNRIPEDLFSYGSNDIFSPYRAEDQQIPEVQSADIVSEQTPESLLNSAQQELTPAVEAVQEPQIQSAPSVESAPDSQVQSATSVEAVQEPQIQPAPSVEAMPEPQVQQVSTPSVEAVQEPQVQSASTQENSPKAFDPVDNKPKLIKVIMFYDDRTCIEYNCK